MRRSTTTAAPSPVATTTLLSELPEEVACRLRPDELEADDESRPAHPCALRLAGDDDDHFCCTTGRHLRYQELHRERHIRSQRVRCPHRDAPPDRHENDQTKTVRPYNFKHELPRCRIHPYLATLLLLLCTMCGIAGRLREQQNLTYQRKIKRKIISYIL